MWHTMRDVLFGGNQATVYCLGCGEHAPTKSAFRERWGNGCPGTNGTVGAPGRLISVSEILARRRIAVSSIPDDGLKAYQGQSSDISWRSKGGQVVEYTLTVSFDSKTAGRLLEYLYSLPGERATAGTVSSPMIVTLEPPTTSPSTSPRSR